MDPKRVILVVEDSEKDITKLKEAIRRAKIPNPIQVVRDGEEARDYLEGSGRFEDRRACPFPGALFLDLNLPRLDGFRVLKWLKEHEECRVIPVMVLTASGLVLNQKTAYEMGANSYIVKPTSFDEL